MGNELNQKKTVQSKDDGKFKLVDWQEYEAVQSTAFQTRAKLSLNRTWRRSVKNRWRYNRWVSTIKDDRRVALVCPASAPVIYLHEYDWTRSLNKVRTCVAVSENTWSNANRFCETTFAFELVEIPLWSPFFRTWIWGGLLVRWGMTAIVEWAWLGGRIRTATLILCLRIFAWALNESYTEIINRWFSLSSIVIAIFSESSARLVPFRSSSSTCKTAKFHQNLEKCESWKKVESYYKNPGKCAQHFELWTLELGGWSSGSDLKKKIGGVSRGVDYWRKFAHALERNEKTKENDSVISAGQYPWA